MASASRWPLPAAAHIDLWQRQALATAGWPDAGMPDRGDSLVLRILENHRCNTLLWQQEDLARRPHAPDREIVANKRAIDRFNQQRNDAIEAIDEIILERAGAGAASRREQPAWVNSETAGSIIDRLSIGSLKVHHMRLQCERADAGAQHRRACLAKLAQLRAQREHLCQCLDALLHGLQTGRCTYRTYRQFKMYNDPALNPYLYDVATQAGAA